MAFSCFRAIPGLRTMIIGFFWLAEGLHKKTAGGDLRRFRCCGWSRQPQAPVRRVGKVIPSNMGAGELPKIHERRLTKQQSGSSLKKRLAECFFFLALSPLRPLRCF